MRRLLEYGLIGVLAAGGGLFVARVGTGSTTAGDPPSVEEDHDGYSTGAPAQVLFSLPSMTVPSFPGPTVAATVP